MPYYIGEEMREWQEYQEWEHSGVRREQPLSLFKYIDPSQARTDVLPFPAMPGPEPERPEDAEFSEDMEAASAYALWKISGQTATCRDLGVKRVFGHYDGGGDESFTQVLGIEMSDGRVIPAESAGEEVPATDCDQLVDDAVCALMGHYGEGPFTLHGVVIIDLDACTITDEKNADVVFGDKMPWEI